MPRPHIRRSSPRAATTATTIFKTQFHISFPLRFVYVCDFQTRKEPNERYIFLPLKRMCSSQFTLIFRMSQTHEIVASLR